MGRTVTPPVLMAAVSVLLSASVAAFLVGIDAFTWIVYVLVTIAFTHSVSLYVTLRFRRVDKPLAHGNRLWGEGTSTDGDSAAPHHHDAIATRLEPEADDTESMRGLIAQRNALEEEVRLVQQMIDADVFKQHVTDDAGASPNSNTVLQQQMSSSVNSESEASTDRDDAGVITLVGKPPPEGSMAVYVETNEIVLAAVPGRKPPVHPNVITPVRFKGSVEFVQAAQQPSITLHQPVLYQPSIAKHPRDHRLDPSVNGQLAKLPLPVAQVYTKQILRGMWALHAARNHVCLCQGSGSGPTPLGDSLVFVPQDGTVKIFPKLDAKPCLSGAHDSMALGVWLADAAVTTGDESELFSFLRACARGEAVELLTKHTFVADIGDISGIHTPRLASSSSSLASFASSEKGGPPKARNTGK